jgi:hypothetical protein
MYALSHPQLIVMQRRDCPSPHVGDLLIRHDGAKYRVIEVTADLVQLQLESEGAEC